MSRRRKTQDMKNGTSSSSPSELAEGVELTMDPVSDDPELAAAVARQNAELEAAGIPRETVRVPMESAPMADDMDLSEDLARMNESMDLADPEEFEDEAPPEIKPSLTINEFQNNVALAQMHGIEQIEADRKVINHFTKPHYPKNRFFHFQGIRVVETGMTEHVEKILGMSIEDKVFKHRARVGR